MSVKMNSLSSTSKNPVQEQQKESNPYYGIYQGYVRRTDDYTRTGKILVFIPALEKDASTTNGLRECTWTSPFAGSTPAIAVGKNVEKYEETQKSYGMWMVPPDIGNLVLVAFGDGDIKNGFIVGCVFSDVFNYMVPGMASGKSYGDPSMQVPVAEKNKKEAKTTHNDAIRPIAPYLAEGIVKQGLINDPIRGAGSASARREAPSQVFGILTPGPLKPGSSATSTEVNTHRIGGHQFIMDDNPGSRMIRLRTAGGTQLMLDDTTGSIYMINKSGKGWFEIDPLGNMNFYAEGSMSIRAKGNLNLRADKNVNIEAGNDINLRAAGDNVGDQYLGPNPAKTLGGPPLGTGGAIRLDAASDIQQFAALNYGVTAAGGDVDISAGNRVAVTPSGPLGFQLLCPMGPIAMTTLASGVSINATAGLGVVGGAPIGLVAPTILLNSGPGFLFPPTPAVGPGPIGLNDHKDQPAAAPEFDLDAALEGKSAVKNAGKRQGKQDTIKSIVTNLITAEPYAGHAQGADPGKEDPTAKGADPAITKDLPPAASTQDGKPDDAQTPGGSKGGDVYKDQNGNTVSTATTSPSLANKAKAAVANRQAQAGSAAKKLNDSAAKANAELNKIKNAIPTYADIRNAINNFGAALEKKIDEILGLSAFVASIKAMVPPIRFPTVNALQQKVLGSIKQLKELEAQLKQFSLDKFGLPIDLNIPAIQDLKNNINSVMAQAKDGLDAVNKLKELGIEVVNDAGSIIYKDSLGNTLVDFNGGVGPIANSLALQSELAKTFNNIKSAVNVPLSDNQTQALAFFAKDIGEENFRNSDIVKALNEGKYNEVPRLMMQWSLGPEAGSNLPTPTNQLVYRQDYNDRRYFQGQVFQSPDNLDISPPPGTADGELSPRQMADLIKARRDDFNAANYNGPTEYYSGPNG
jgi:hypothetical protein